jgi:hypothetical protein
MNSKITLAIALTFFTVSEAAPQDRSQSLVTLYVKTAENRTKVGTGFAVAPGILATAYHVVQGGLNIELVRASGAVTQNVTIRNISPEKDLALLEASDLENMPSLPVKSRIAPVDEDLFMIGSAAGIPNSTYTVRLVQSQLVPITAFNNTRGQPLFDKPPKTEVLQIAGIVYGGISGGPLIDRQGNVLGVLSGSLNEGGSYGWVIPSRDVEQMLTSTPTRQKLDTAVWPPVPFRTALLRSTEYFVRQDTAVQNEFDGFTAKANRLSSINNAIELDALLLSSNLSQDATSIRVVLATPQSFGPVTPSEINNSFLVSTRSILFGGNWQRLKSLRANLGERYAIDRGLRGLVSRLGEVANREGLDPASTEKIHQAAQTIAASDPEVASNNFEGQRGVDIRSLTNALDKVLTKREFKFSTLEEARRYMNALQTSADLLNDYNSGPFRSWVPKEKLYFEDAAKFLRRFRPVLVYVPEQSPR